MKIPSDIFRQMVDQAREATPIEACGILAGSQGKVKRLYKMTNADNHNDHFMMVPREQFRVVKDIRSTGLEMLAIYHSHPATPARPSAEDIRLALTPHIIYVIASLQNLNNPVVKGFLIQDGEISEVPIKIVEY